VLALRPSLWAAVAAIAIAIAACGAPAASVTATLKDFTITLDRPTISAGSVTISAKNNGAMPHRLVVIKTDVAFDKLPIDQTTLMASEVGKVAEILSVAVGQTATVTVTLAPGRYVVICNLPEHYELGMRAPLTVQ